MGRKITIDGISILLIILFVYTAFSKWVDMNAFNKAMHNQPFPTWFADTLIWCLPSIEMLVAILLIFKRTQLMGFYAAFILMILFTGYIGAILLHLFPRVPCSCGGVIKQLGWRMHLLFNLFFVAVSLWAIILTRKKHTYGDFMAEGQMSRA